MAVESSKESRFWFVGTRLEPSRDNFSFRQDGSIQKHNLEASNDQLPQILINADLNDAGRVNECFSSFLSNSDTLLRQRTKCVFSAASVSLCHPTR